MPRVNEGKDLHIQPPGTAHPDTKSCRASWTMLHEGRQPGVFRVRSTRARLLQGSDEQVGYLQGYIVAAKYLHVCDA